MERLFAPVDPAEFVAKHWDQQRVLHIPGDPSKFEDIYSLADFGAMLDRTRRGDLKPMIKAYAGEQRRPNPVDVALGRAKDSELGSSGVAATGDQIDEWLATGATVYLFDFAKLDEKAGAVENQLKEDLSFPGDMFCDGFVSTGGSGFYLLHIDNAPSITLQLHGEKTWRVSETPAVWWPKDNAKMMSDGKARYHNRSTPLAPWEDLGELDPARLRTIVMKPGDVLFVPAGCWHGVRSDPDKGSVSMAFGAMQPGISGVAPAEAITDLEGDVAWRHPPLTWPPHRGPGLPQATQRFYQRRAAAIARWLEAHPVKG